MMKIGDKMEYIQIEHTFEPVWNKCYRILILGTFPSVKSRENQFYYGHPQNRFWKVLAALTESMVPQTIEEKKKMLLENGIAIWYVIQRCSIQGSSDSSIRDVVANDIASLLGKSKISKIYGNGAKACELYDKFVREQTGIDIQKLPSTSPANAMYQLERLQKEWGRILDKD